MNGLLKFITCGSVDDGKSTLIGHILYDSKLLYTDQEKALLLDSKVGSRGGAIDYSLLLDGLMAEREQGITIDVAYRYFTTEQRSFIVADTPGHEEYTRNMAVGASFAQLAIILVDAKQGVLIQTKRHARICSLMGINHFVFAVNKMDLVNYSQQRFLEIKEDIDMLVKELSLKNSKIIPVSATEGDNVTKPSENMSWYQDEILMTHLERVNVSESVESTDFYMPVQRVCRPNHNFRGFQGQIEAGKVVVGQKLFSLPSNESALVESILVGDKDAKEAVAGQAVTIQLDREVDVSRGCVLSDCENLPVAKNIVTTILWMDDEPLHVGKDYLVKVGTKMIPAIVKDIEYKIDVNTGEHLSIAQVTKNEIIRCEIEFTEKIVVDEFHKNKTLGELIMIDRISHMTSACGVVEHIETHGEKPYFEKESLKAKGYIFEEFYFNLENAFLSRTKTKDKTYHVGDSIPTEGDSFKYPDFFDILSVEDSVAVLIRNAKIADIISIDVYEYGGLPVLDERGFALHIKSQADVDNYLYEYKQLSSDKKMTFVNKWSRFEGYRRIVCNDNFWMI
ncbi:sulfate adenylyltransferase subunit 1 [Candidatus Galacturonibacter soehngenii]|uniref:sulfate adenylyltransferase n=1 Tax=Candidatus Galacturonatibacter soehngenii TaxID=2307010 RepID=A0A7V7QMS6_9FIRM|nr:GTP-binding protein [Candidatus Galacturonibacter soehngenii]KAB1439969.1 sulfate adenylyltransferase [Candidatus Galacturonibacter soehngenii]MBA4685786.1 sulfate adenylyltransferase [Candidatus Galacturonibacter soehngenii]